MNTSVLKETSGLADVALTMLISRGSLSNALSLPNPPRVRKLIEAFKGGGTPRADDVLRKAVAGTAGDGESASGTWGGELAQYRLLSDAFIEGLGPFGALDRIIADRAYRAMPIRTAIGVVVAGGSGSDPGEAGLKTFTELGLDQRLLAERKSVAVIGITDELARNATPVARQCFERELRAAAAASADQIFLGAIGDAAQSIASVGGDADGVHLDFKNALLAIPSSATSKFYAIVHPDRAKAWATMSGDHGRVFPEMTVSGGQICGVTVALSDAAAEDEMIVVDADQLLVDPGVAAVDATSVAALAMEGEQLLSLWQTNMSALRVERLFGCELARATAVTKITDMESVGVTA